MIVIYYQAKLSTGTPLSLKTGFYKGFMKFRGIPL